MNSNIINALSLEHRLENGSWVSCVKTEKCFDAETKTWTEVIKDRSEEFLQEACAYNSLTLEAALLQLEQGKELRQWGGDWYPYLRSGAAVKRISAERMAKAKPVQYVECACGHTIPSSDVMSASRGSSCPDCYDKMSD